MIIFIHFLILSILFTISSSVGISRHRSLYNTRMYDIPIDGIPCEQPTFISYLPLKAKETIQKVWKKHIKGHDCWLEMAITRNVLMQLTPQQRSQIIRRSRSCNAPEVVKTLPRKAQRRIMEIWKERDPAGNCWEQQRRTRLILLNLPATLKGLLHPPSFQCTTPHFIDRLEWDLQIQLRRIWDDYKEGEECTHRIEKQLRLLEEKEISLQSFNMPPPTSFTTYQLLHKLKKENVA